MHATNKMDEQTDATDTVSQEENVKSKKSRYYLEEADSSDDLSDVSVPEIDEITKTDSNVECTPPSNPINTRKRPKLGKLPSYIPII